MSRRILEFHVLNFHHGFMREFNFLDSNRLQKQITELEEELKNTQEDLESLAQEREETVDQYEERIVELENEVSKLSKDHEEELQQVNCKHFKGIAETGLPLPRPKAPNS